jgi:hypothetical protein
VSKKRAKKSGNFTIEGYSLPKLLIFVLVFLIVIMFMIFTFIIPNIKSYKITKKEYNTQKLINMKMQRLKENKLKKLKRLKKENRRILSAFNTKFDEKSFLKFANQFFINSSLSKSMKPSLNDSFVTYEFNVSTNIKTPANFYNFLEKINTYSNIVEAEFPITFSAKDDIIYSSFKIKVYELNNSK